MTGIAEYFAVGLLALMGLILVGILLAMIFGPVIRRLYEEYKDEPLREVLYLVLKISAVIVGFLLFVVFLGFVSVEYLGFSIESSG